jgi:hypothetical protein
MMLVGCARVCAAASAGFLLDHLVCAFFKVGAEAPSITLTLTLAVGAEAPSTASAAGGASLEQARAEAKALGGRPRMQQALSVFFQAFAGGGGRGGGLAAADRRVAILSAATDSLLRRYAAAAAAAGRSQADGAAAVSEGAWSPLGSAAVSQALLFLISLFDAAEGGAGQAAGQAAGAAELEDADDADDDDDEEEAAKVHEQQRDAAEWQPTRSGFPGSVRVAKGLCVLLGSPALSALAMRPLAKAAAALPVPKADSEFSHTGVAALRDISAPMHCRITTRVCNLF